MMKKVLSLILMFWVLVFAVSVGASPKQDDGDGGAGGDKVESWQRTGDLPTAHLPLTMDLEFCTWVAETSTLNIYECDSFVFGTFTATVPK